VGSTPTQVTPRIGDMRPPGSVISNGWSRLTPIILPASKAATGCTSGSHGMITFSSLSSSQR
jgi:hypothetical protein